MRPGPQHAQPQTEALSNLRAVRGATARTTAFRAPGPRNKPERALSLDDPGGSPGPRDDRKRMRRRRSAARDRAPPRGGQRSGQPTTGNAYATTQHDRRPSSVVRRTLRRPCSGCNESVSKRNSTYLVGARGDLAVQSSSRPSASKSMAASSTRARASLAATAAWSSSNSSCESCFRRRRISSSSQSDRGGGGVTALERSP